MRSRYLAIFGSTFFSVIILVALAMNGRVAAEPAGQVVGGATLPTTFRVSETASGEEGDGDSTIPAISANGRFVAFASQAGNLDLAFDANGFQDIFLKDLETKVITGLIGISQGLPGNSTNPDVSASGHAVVFESEASNFGGEFFDGDDQADIYIYLRDQQIYELLSQGIDGSGNGPSYLPSISADGSKVAFVSEASDLSPDDIDRVPDIYVVTVNQNGFPENVEVVSVSSQGIKGNGPSTNPSISADGRYVAFQSDATNLLPQGQDSNGVSDIFVRDLETGITIRVSVDSGGGQVQGASSQPSLSFNGQVIAFTSAASDLVTNDNNDMPDIFVHNRQTGNTRRVSVDSNGNEAEGPSDFPNVTDSGTAVVFRSLAPNLVTDDGNDVADIFWHNLVSGATRRVSLAYDGVESNGGVGAPTVSADGRLTAFDSAADNLIPSDGNNVLDVFVREEDFPAKSFRYTAKEVPVNTTVVDSVESETAVQLYKFDVNEA